MDLNWKNMKKIAILITFTVLLTIGVSNLGKIADALQTMLRLLAPFIVGGCIAFVINVPLSWIEHKLFSRMKPTKFLYKSKRAVSLVLTLMLIVGIFAVAVGIIAPQIGRSVTMLGHKMPGFMDRLEAWNRALQIQFPFLSEQIAVQDLHWTTLDWNGIGKRIMEFLQSGAVGKMLGSTFTVASSIIGGVVNFFLGLFFAIYVLCQKEKLQQQGEKILYAIFSKETVEKIIGVFGLIQHTFANFISGQCTEAVILGLMFFITMSILRFPYALLVGVLICITAIIPIFGAFLGCAVGAFFILVESPMQALWFVVVFLILQQIEGNFVYPNVVGNSVGLPSIWVLVAVTLGASTFGIMGMIVFIPLFSVLYTLIRRATYRKLQQRGIVLPNWNMPKSASSENNDKEE